jgi:catechol-2,3-dioxygenase
MAQNTTFRPVDPKVRIGHVHLKVADLERSLAFRDVLGFELTQRIGQQAAFPSAGACVSLPARVTGWCGSGPGRRAAAIPVAVLARAEKPAFPLAVIQRLDRE